MVKKSIKRRSSPDKTVSVFSLSTAMETTGSDNSAEVQFRQKLVEMCADHDGKKTVLLKKDEYFNLIDEVKAADTAEIKTGRQYYILKR